VKACSLRCAHPALDYSPCEEMEEPSDSDANMEPGQDTPRPNECQHGSPDKKSASFDTNPKHDANDADAIKPKMASLRKKVTEYAHDLNLH
jgi:hypothetical protein